MRILILFCLILLYPITIVKADVTTVIYYRFGEDGVADYNAPRDSSGNKYNITYAATATATISTSAPSGGFSTKSTFIDGTNWFSTPYGGYDAKVTNNIGVEAWIKLGKVNQTNAYVFGSVWVTDSDAAGIAIMYDQGSNGFYGCLPRKTTNFSLGYMPASTNEWVHLAIVRDNGVTSFYVNGTNYGGTTTLEPYFPSYNVVFRIGGVDHTFAGNYDEFRLFTFAAGTFSPTNLLCYSATNRPQLLGYTYPLYHLKKTNTIYASVGDTIQVYSPSIGDSIVHRWYTNNVLTSLSTSNKLSLPINANLNGTTIYYTASNSFGSVTSSVVDLSVLNLITPTQSTNPNAVQLSQINRSYGMFIHYGINTYWNGVAPDYWSDWSDGTLASTVFAPTNIIDTDQWAQTAVNAGMKYIIFTSKHHDGFCLWPSVHTTYSVAYSGGVYQDVLYNLARSCSKYNLSLGIYYSLWDRHQNSTNLDTYFPYMTNQIAELLTKYGPVCELWLDGASTHYPTDWRIPEVYNLVKTLQPNCAMVVNNTLGTVNVWDSTTMNNGTGPLGTPSIYWPVDFRTKDPWIVNYPETNKLFQAMTVPDSSFHLPFESTSILDAGGVTNGTTAQWFWHEDHTNVISVDSLLSYYTNAILASNICVFNVGPNREGKIINTQSNLLYQFRENVNVNLPMIQQKYSLTFGK